MRMASTGLRHIATEPANLDLRYSSSVKDKMERSPRLKQKSKSQTGLLSDSEVSGDSHSLSADSIIDVSNSPSKPVTPLEVQKNPKSKWRNRGRDWEIIGGVKDADLVDQVPPKSEGFLLKKRKWPLKGWHKRYFVLDKGILVYAKRPVDITRGKPHGTVDLGQSVISAKTSRRRIDIDAEVFIYHIKVKSREIFVHWVEQLKIHRLYRQQLGLSNSGSQAPPSNVTSPGSPAEDTAAEILPVHNIIGHMGLEGLVPISRESSLQRGLKGIAATVNGVGQPRAVTWAAESTAALESLNKELGTAQEKMARLQIIVEHTVSTSSSMSVHGVDLIDGTPTTKKDRKKFGLRRKKAKSTHISEVPQAMSVSLTETDSGAASVVGNLERLSQLSNSIPSLMACNSGDNANSLFLAVDATNPAMISPTDKSFPQTPTKTDDLYSTAKDVHNSLNSALKMLQSEYEKFKQWLEAADSLSISSGSRNPNNTTLVAGLRNALQQALQQNAELKQRLQRIRAETDVNDLVPLPSITIDLASQRSIHHSLSYSSSCVSQSEFYDAKEYLTEGEADVLTDSSSEASLSAEGEEEGSILSEASEADVEIVTQPGPVLGALSCSTGRRTRLPAPMPSTEELSLWNLLRRNIGKDLSKVSMPVALNEPISMLQRLCEELEYCELLDKAAETEDPYERLVLVTAFAISPYGSSHFRAGHKPFNPLLSETYECVREDKGFKFIAEQVSHHPPISVCHASSSNYEFWQDTRIKTKFWGKSMEFQPLGTVNVVLNKTGDHYRWNKITTCVHNLFGGSRWVDQYGEMVVTASSGLKCQLTFVKASYWSSNRHEVYGTVMDAQGKVVHSLFGKWSEGLYWGSAPSAKCVWRPAALPEDHELYYGFSRFTIELNELEQTLVPILPPTDSRFRPDQRLLEEGQVNAAENMKLQLEQAQRERRNKSEPDGVPHIPRWFRKVVKNQEEHWEFIGNYWEVRTHTGFANLALEKLW